MIVCRTKEKFPYLYGNSFCFCGNATNASGLNTMAMSLGSFTNPLTLEITNSGSSQTFNIDNVNLTQDGITGVSYYTAQLVSAQDCYPFGTTLPGRTFQDDRFGGYRFRFNGKELDKEGMGGGGNTYDYGFRIYNANLAKFLSVDPLIKKFPWYTPYQFAGNTPLAAVDLDGLEELIIIRWYDGDNFKGVTYFRIMNAQDRLPNHRNGGDGLYVKLDYRLKGAIERQLTDNTWKPTFFNIANNTPVFGEIRTTLTNQKDKDARNNLESQNNRPGKEGNNAILFGSPKETVFFKQNSSEYESNLIVDENNVCNDDAIKASKLFIKANPDYSIVVVGSANTDNASGDFDNQNLSENRANITLSKLTEGANSVPSTKIINNGGVGPSEAMTGRTPQGTKELNRNATVNFIIPR